FGKHHGSPVAEKRRSAGAVPFVYQAIGGLQSPACSLKVSNLKQRRIESLYGTRLEISVSRLDGFLHSLTGEQERLVVVGSAPGEIEEPVKDVGCLAMLSRGPAYRKIKPEFPLRLVHFSVLL